MKPLIKIIFILLGSISFGLGILGAFLPVLPTTPFILLAAGLYMRSSERLYNYLLNHQYFGKMVRNFWIHKSLSKRTKTFAISTMWGSLMLSSFFVSKTWYHWLMFIAVGVGVSIWILSYKTSSENE